MKAPGKPTIRTFTQATYLEALADCGWLDALPIEARQALTARIAKALPSGMKAAATKLCDLLAIYEVDAEMIHEPGSYRRMLEELAAASNGTFQPRKIKDTLSAEDERASIRFELGGKPFSIDVPLRNDWIERDVIDVLVNGALRATGVAERFRVLPSTDQMLELAFVPDEVWRKAVVAGLIPADRVDPLRERKPCSEEQLAARLPPGEGVPGLHEWCGQLRDAIIGEVRDSGTARITLGLGRISVRPGREPGLHKMTFHADAMLRNVANGDPNATVDDADDVVTAIVGLLRDGFDEFPLRGIGTLRVRAMPAYTGRNPRTGEEVEVGAHKMVELDFATDLRSALRGSPKRISRRRS